MTKNISDFETNAKNAKRLLTKSYRQKKCAKLEFVLFYTTYLQKFLANPISGALFSNYFHGFNISIRFCEF
jgi:hypothetical protein